MEKIIALQIMNLKSGTRGIVLFDRVVQMSGAKETAYRFALRKIEEWLKSGQPFTLDTRFERTDDPLIVSKELASKNLREAMSEMNGGAARGLGQNV